VAAAADTLRDPMANFFHQSFGDLQEELDTARTEDKRGLLVMFESEDCPWCKKMHALVLNQAPVQDYYRQHFRIVSVDTEGDTELIDFNGQPMPEKDFALKHNRVRATPVFAFFDLDGDLIFKYTGATRDIDEFMWLAEFVVDGRYKTENFPKYKRERRAQARNQS
jgi:thioredoxin-related protein